MKASEVPQGEIVERESMRFHQLVRVDDSKSPDGKLVFYPVVNSKICLDGPVLIDPDKEMRRPDQN